MSKPEYRKGGAEGSGSVWSCPSCRQAAEIWTSLCPRHQLSPQALPMITRVFTARRLLVHGLVQASLCVLTLCCGTGPGSICLKKMLLLSFGYGLELRLFPVWDLTIFCRYEGFMHWEVTAPASTIGYHVLLHQVVCASVSGEQEPDVNAIRIQWWFPCFHMQETWCLLCLNVSFQWINLVNAFF